MLTWSATTLSSTRLSAIASTKPVKVLIRSQKLLRLVALPVCLLVLAVECLRVPRAACLLPVWAAGCLLVCLQAQRAGCLLVQRAAVATRPL